MPPTRPRLAAGGAVLFLALGLGRTDAQETDPHSVQPERPTVATHAGTVAPGWLELEAGVEVDHYERPPRGIQVPIEAKVGLTSRTQLDLFVPVVRPPDAGSFAPGDLAFGVKWRLADDLPVLGRFALLPILKVPTGRPSSGAGTGTVDGSLVLISSHEFGPVSLDVNAGYTRRSGDGSRAPRNATVWTVSSGGPGPGPVGWVAEVYGYPRTAGRAGQSAIVAALFGPTLSLRSWLALDAGVIVPLAGPQPRALYAGAVWNVGRLSSPSLR